MQTRPTHDLAGRPCAACGSGPYHPQGIGRVTCVRCGHGRSRDARHLED